MTIVEVVVTSLMVGLIALTLIGLDAAGKTTADQRRRSQAFSVAQADQERIKGLSGDQISTLNQDRTVTLDGVAYSVHSTGQFLSQSAGSASCSSSGAAADSAKVTSTVNWTTNLRAPITVTSVISPRAGGSLLAKVLDQNAAVLPGVKITAAGSDPTNSAIRRFGTTDADGCTIFSVLPVGDYTVTPALAGYVDKDGNAAPTTTVTTTAGNTTSAPFTLGQAGRVTAAFSTTIAGDHLPEPEGAVALLVQRRRWRPRASPSRPRRRPRSRRRSRCSRSWSRRRGTTPTTTPSGPGAAWPPSRPSSRTSATSRSGRARARARPGPTAVAMPGMVVSVTYAGNPVKPAHIKLTDSCGQTWSPAISPAAAPPADAEHGLAGPAGPAVWHLLDLRRLPVPEPGVAAARRSSNFRKVTLTGRANTSFTAANSSTVAIATTSATGFC